MIFKVMTVKEITQGESPKKERKLPRGQALGGPQLL